jgi:hypothetical protein
MISRSARGDTIGNTKNIANYSMWVTHKYRQLYRQHKKYRQLYRQYNKYSKSLCIGISMRESFFSFFIADGFKIVGTFLEASKNFIFINLL